MSFSETSDLSSVEHLSLHQRHHIEAAEAAESALLPGGGWGRMLVLFCCRVLGKQSSAPFGPSSSPLVVEPGFVCRILL